MHRWSLAPGLMLALAVTGAQAQQPATSLQIDWEVANRFRLFADQREFDRHVATLRESPNKSVLSIEQKLAEGSARGWAANIVGELCYDSFRGRIKERCVRDGTDENYLNPQDARIKTSVKLPPDFAAATCEWTTQTGTEQQKLSAPCASGMDQLRASTQRPTKVTVVARNAAGSTLTGETSIKVRDIFVVGLGDSIASGEGNPMKPVRLDHEGFCFRRAITGQRFYLPGRADAVVNKSCQPTDNDVNDREAWDRKAADWLFSGCHRSLYSYQSRVALALALENPQVSVTLLPLGCTGATIREGMVGSKRSREQPVQDGKVAPADVEAQFSELGNYLRSITRNGRRRPVDMVLLTIGANDIGFSGMVADVIISQNPERALAKKQIVSPEQAERDLTRILRPDFATLRNRLRTVTRGGLERVILTTYGNPALHNGGTPCFSTRIGFDAHPSFALNGEALSKTVAFVDNKFLPELKAYATCAPGSRCTNPAVNRMTFVDSHQSEFGNHGVCAASSSDPGFDRACFTDGDSFKSGETALKEPLTCGRNASNFMPYAKRARWIRTVNDSYFSAMTYPSNGSFATPSDIHDGRWGLEAVVYGGAFHPTAEGHAAMADAALVAARRLLALPPAGALVAAR